MLAMAGCVLLYFNRAERLNNITGVPNMRLEEQANTKPTNSNNPPTTWKDSLIIKYFSTTKNELIRLAPKDRTEEEWLFDRVEKTDSAVYFIFHIGHDVEDKNHTNKRFATDGWLYIDSLSRKLYEYDLPNEKLLEWKPNTP